MPPRNGLHGQTVKTACVLLRPSDAYAPDAFRKGFESRGYRVTDHSHNPNPGDVLLVWNRRSVEEHIVRQWEARRCLVLVAENGYLGRDESGGKLFAIASSHHSGAGKWPLGDYDRWTPLEIDLKPWRIDGDHILVLGQRSIGEKGVAMPEGWVPRIVDELGKRTRRPIRVREHPGVARTDPFDDLRNAWAAVTWSSGAALKALVAGYPVFHLLPEWIGRGAAAYGIDDLEEPFLGDRLPTMQRVAWAQWRRSEIASGEALRWYGV